MPLKLVPPRPGKTPYWSVRGTWLGQYIDRSTKAGKRADAAKILRRWRTEIERGEFALPSDPTFASAALAYMNAGGEREYLAPLIGRFGNRPIKAITQLDIDLAAAELYPDASGATRNRQVYTPCSAVLKRGGATWTLKRPAGAQGRALTNFLWPEQAFPLCTAAEALDLEFGIYCWMLLYTGERMSEPLKLRCNDVRLSEGFAFLADSKNGMPRPIFLPPFLVAKLANHPRGLDRGEQRLFRFYRSSHLYAMLRAAAARAEVTLPQGQAFHIFCHTWATWLRRYCRLDTKGLVGTGRWKDRKSADRYEHMVFSEEAARAIELPTPATWRRRARKTGSLRGKTPGNRLRA